MTLTDLRPAAAVAALAEGWVDSGRCSGAQVHVRLGGAPAIDVAVGSDGRGRRCRASDRAPLLCAVKPVLAWCVLRAVGRAELGLADAVADHVAGFTGPGRDGITVEHLLAHTSRLPNGVVPVPYRARYEAVVRAAVHDPLPSHRLAEPHYNAHASWHLLAHLLELRLARPIDEIVAAEMAAIPGCDVTLLAPGSSDLGWYGARRGHGRFVPLVVDEHRVRTWPNPASGGFGSMRGLAALYDEVLRALDGRSSLLAPGLAAELVRPRARVRGRPAPFGTEPRDPWYGLGVVVGVRDIGCRGPWSDDSFGFAGEHGGHPLVVGVADPADDVVLTVRLLSAGVRNAARVAEVTELVRDVVAAR